MKYDFKTTSITLIRIEKRFGRFGTVEIGLEMTTRVGDSQNRAKQDPDREVEGFFFLQVETWHSRSGPRRGLPISLRRGSRVAVAGYRLGCCHELQAGVRFGPRVLRLLQMDWAKAFSHGSRVLKAMWADRMDWASVRVGCRLG